MKVLRRYRRLAWLAGCVTVTLGPASLAAPAAAPAQARVAATPVVSRVVASWGDNAVGQLGDGTTVLRTLFHDIAAGRDVVQVAGGRVHGLALRSDGTLWAWGQNDHGQLGRGIITSEEVAPARVAVGSRCPSPASPPATSSPRSSAPTARSGAGAPTSWASWTSRQPAPR